MISAKAGPHYPAPIASVKAIEEAATFERDGALEIERNSFAHVAKSDTAQALIGLF